MDGWRGVGVDGWMDGWVRDGCKWVGGWEGTEEMRGERERGDSDRRGIQVRTGVSSDT